jgi:putative hydrolase of HD superfamily
MADADDDADDAANAGDADDLDALLVALALKDESRTGWDLRGVRDPESVAAHSWGVAYLTLLYADEAGVDRDRALRMAVLHDVGEAVVGDVATRVDPDRQSMGMEEKERREREAIEDLLGPFDGDLRDLWEEYEARDSPDARFVKDADLVDMCLQALHYEREGRYDPDAENDEFEAFDDLDEFFATAEPRLSTEVGRRLFEEIRERYEDAKG